MPKPMRLRRTPGCPPRHQGQRRGHELPSSHDERHEQRARATPPSGWLAVRMVARQLPELGRHWPPRARGSLVVMAPMMPSLNAPVMRLFVLRTARWYLRIRFWKNTHSAARTGDDAQHHADASFQFMASIARPRCPTANTARPHQVHKAPGDHIRQPGDITHHAGSSASQRRWCRRS